MKHMKHFIARRHGEELAFDKLINLIGFNLKISRVHSKHLPRPSNGVKFQTPDLFLVVKGLKFHTLEDSG